jgi:hypothetical protein
MRLLVSILLALFASGCGSACKTVKETRCNGLVVEMCGSNQKWQRVMDCSQAKSIRPGAPVTMVCGQTTTGCTCIPGGK